MEFVAKPVLEDKFWILEDNGQKVGTIRSNENGVVLTVGKENHSFKRGASARNSGPRATGTWSAPRPCCRALP